MLPGCKRLSNIDAAEIDLILLTRNHRQIREAGRNKEAGGVHILPDTALS